MRRPLAVLGVTGTQVLAWLFQLAAAVAMLWAFHLEAAGLRGAALVIVLTNLIGLIPATPGNVGTFQVAAVAALATYGVAAGPALAYALGLQALQLLVGHRGRARRARRAGSDARRPGRQEPAGRGGASQRRARDDSGGGFAGNLSHPVGVVGRGNAGRFSAPRRCR